MKQITIFNSFVQQEYFQLGNHKVYKEMTPRDYYQTKLDKYIDQGKRELPKVWSHDNMSIKALEDNNKKEDKLFCQNNSRYDKTREKRAGIVAGLSKIDGFRWFEV